MHHIEKEHDGTQCPYCGSDEFEGGDVETGCGQATQEMFCLSCEREWVDAYTLAGYELRSEIA